MLTIKNGDGSIELSKLGNIVAGSFAGGFSRVLVAPLDVVKIRFQTQYQVTYQNQKPKYKSMSSALYLIAREEGLKALWAGNLMAEMLWITFSAAQFTTYHELRRDLPPALASDALCGAAAGVVATIFSYPFDLIRTRFASQGIPKVYHSSFDVVKSIYRSQVGLRGIFAGLVPTLLQIAPGAAIQFSVYEKLKILFKPTEHSQFASFYSGLIGSVSGAVAKISIYPLDTVKKRLQIIGMNRSGAYGPIISYKGTSDAIFSILKEEGFLALYRGLTPAIMKSAPATGLTFASYEFAKRKILSHSSS